MTLGKNFRLPTDIKPKTLRRRPAPGSGRRPVRRRAGDRGAAGRRAARDHRARGRPGGDGDARAERRRRPTRRRDSRPATPRARRSRWRSPSELPAGDARLRIAYRGAFSPGLRGLYRAGSSPSRSSRRRTRAALFPCFDEPAFKAVWRLRVAGVPNQAIAISNGKVITRRERRRAAGGALTFAPTPPLSSYLVALIVGPLVAEPDRRSARDVPITHLDDARRSGS